MQPNLSYYMQKSNGHNEPYHDGRSDFNEHELVNSLIQIDGCNPQMNNMIVDDVRPAYVELNCKFQQPIRNIYDITLLSFIYSNTHYRITKDSNTVVIVINKGTSSYALTYDIPPGNYTPEHLELVLNEGFHAHHAPAGGLVIQRLTGQGGSATVVLTDQHLYNPFNLTGGGGKATDGKTLIKMRLPNGCNFSMHILRGPVAGVDPRIEKGKRLSNILGFIRKMPIETSQRALNDNDEVELISNTYHNPTLSSDWIHVRSNAIANISERLPSINALGKSSIVYSAFMTEEAVQKMRHSNPYPALTRIKATPYAELSEIDVALCGDDFEKIDNDHAEDYSFLFLVRTLKPK